MMNRKQRRAAASQNKRTAASLATPKCATAVNALMSSALRAEAHIKRGNTIERALVAKPGLAEAHNRRSETALTAKNQAASIDELMTSALGCHQGGRLAEAEHFYRRILTIDPNHIGGLHNLGLIEHQRGQHETAVALLRRAIAANDQVPDCHNSMGIALCALRRFDEGAIHYNKALALDPKHAEAHNNLGNALRGQGKSHEAISLFERAVDLKPDFAEAHNNLGNAIRDRGKSQEAILHYRRALSGNPRFADAYNNLGSAFYELGQLDDAVAQYERAVALRPDYAEAHNNLGNALKARGEVDKAVGHYERALVVKPSYAEAHQNYGDALQFIGKYHAAVGEYRLALALNPQLPGIQNNLGNAFKALGKFDLAASAYERALDLQPNQVEARLNFGNLLKSRGKLDDAVVHYQRALAFDPHHARAHNLLGIAYQNQGKLDEAVVHHLRALAVTPNDADAHNSLGNARRAQGNLGEAIAEYRRALEIKPDAADAHNNLGNVLKQLGHVDDAIEHYRQALKLNPDYAEAYSNLGMTFQDLGRLDEAVWQFERALILKPDLAEAHSNLGAALRDQGKVGEAIAQFERALFLKPELAEAHSNLGTALQSIGKLDDAVARFEHALKLNPELAEAYSNLGAVFKEQGRLIEAIAQFERALAVKPDFVAAHSNLLFCLMYDERLSVEQLFAAHQRWDGSHGHANQRRTTYPNERSSERRLRVGYVSPDFRQHSVAWFLRPLIELHDRATVEIFCYAEVRRADDVTERFRSLADHWRTTVGLSHDAVAEQIAADCIDVLVDVSGHTAGNRLPVFARKPAPVQVTWLGYPHSTGLSTIDYRLVDAVTDPETEGNSAASEKLVRLDGSFVCYAPPIDAPPPLPLGPSSDIVTFGSFNNPAKYSGATLDAWAELLKQVPQSRLLLKGIPFADPRTRDSYHEQFSRRGVSPQRITLVERMPSQSSHLKHYDEIDIALDPFPYNGTTTTCEALWMGVPVVALNGNRHSGRVSASLLTSIGATDLIGGDIDEYIRIAVRLARDRPHLAKLKGALREQMAVSRLCDASGFARKIERAFRLMWRRWCEETPNSAD